MTAAIELRELKLFIQQCDPKQPLETNDPRYVSLDQGEPVRGDGRSCIDDLQRTVVLSDAPTCQIFTGFQGTGKTTELHRLRSRLTDEKSVPLHAILIDFEQYLNPYVAVSISDVLRVLAYALDREATRAEGGDPADSPGYLRRLFDFLARTDVELQKVGFAQAGATLMAELKENPTFRQKIEAALSLRFQLFAKEAQEVIAEAIVRLRRATHAQQVVVIADGLDKFRPTSEEDRASVEASVQTLFVEHALWLRLPCHVIYTFPLWLRFRTAELDAGYDREAQILPMVKVSDRHGGLYAPGFAKLTELVARRMDINRVFGTSLEPTLHPLIAASWGYPRDFIRMVREVLWQASSFPVAPGEVQRIIARLGETYARTIRTPDVDILAEVARTHDLPRGDGERLNAFGRLLEKFLVLAYRNGSEWYDLHPFARSAPIVKEHLAAAAEPAP